MTDTIETPVTLAATMNATPAATPLDNEDIFVTEKSTFDSKIRFYRKDGQLIVENVDDEFSADGKEVREFTFTCKYPSQADFQTILNAPVYKNMNEIRGIDLVQLETLRLSVLIRKWSLTQDLSRLREVEPKFIKAMLAGVSKEIGLKGIL